jgi:hypothetical protein
MQTLAVRMTWQGAKDLKRESLGGVAAVNIKEIFTT